MDVFDAAERYKQEGRQLIILAGKDYGSGSCRDWAAKGVGKTLSVTMNVFTSLLYSCNVTEY